MENALPISNLHSLILPTPARIVSVRDDNYRTKTFVLDARLDAAPGQFVMAWLPRFDEKPFSLVDADPVTLMITAVGPFSRLLHARGVFPPIDVLTSLSRLMNAGIGPGKTAPEHRAWADQLYASYARGREARMTAAIVGEAGLPEADRRAIVFARVLEDELLGQVARRTIGETIEAGWRVLETLPRDDLDRLDEKTWRQREEHAR